MKSRDPTLITKICNNFERENKNLLSNVEQLIYYSRGCLSRDDGLALTPYEREIKAEFLEKKFEEVKEFIKQKIPIFW